jgi:glycine betaine catabolism B
MLRALDNLLNRITMYRLVLYYLIFLLAAALLLTLGGILKYDVFAFLFSTAFLLAVSLAVNWLFAKVFKVAANVESAYISALILALIITPIHSMNDLWFLGWAAVLSTASKYILAINRKHLFNPAALAVAITYFSLNRSASWWVGSGPMLAFVLLGGILVVRRISRWDLVLAFLLTSAAASLVLGLFTGGNPLTALQQVLLSSPLFFFGFVILTEPHTTPPTRPGRIGYGVLVGLLFTPQLSIGKFFITPELAILMGNLFSYTTINPKKRVVLTLKEKNRIAPDIYDFVFSHARHLDFTPGQYMEWTLGHDHPDARGNRRYFTLASAPTEKNLRVGVKINQHSSTFKRALLEMSSGDEIIAEQVTGDFVLPKDPRQKCVFIAGGVGVTPFRSMVKYLLDTRQPRPMVLFYAAPTLDELVYRDIFERAKHDLGLQVIYTLTDPAQVPPNWSGAVGRITPALIKSCVPDYGGCIYYLSGPRGMVDSFKDSLARMDIPRERVRTDFFAGLA